MSAVRCGDAAVERARSEPIDLIVADVRMKGLDGLQALEEARRYQSDVGSLVISGYTSEAETLRALDLEVGGFLKKPFPMDEFLHRVEALLHEKERSRRWAEGQASLGRAFLWAVEALASSRPPLARAGELAYRVAEQLGYTAAICREFSAAAVLIEGRRSHGLTPPDPLLSGQTGHPVLARLLSFPWEEESDEPPPLTIQVVDLALRAGARPSYPLAAEIEKACATALCLGPREACLSPGVAARVGFERGLLSLARALEQSGNLESAARAYAQIAELEEPTPEVVEALHGLVRLALSAGRLEEARKFALAAVERARPLGESMLGRAQLKAGLALEEGDLLEQAAAALHRSGLSFEEAQARLALAGLRPGIHGLERALKSLEDPRYTPELADSLPWLLPVLLRLEGGRELALRIANAFPRRSAEVTSNLPAERRSRFLGWLETSSSPALLEPFLADPDPGIRGRAAVLSQRLVRPQTPHPMLRIHTFGRFEVLVGEAKVADWATQKTRYLFALLAAEAGRPLCEDAILEEFWPEHRSRGKRSLYQATSALRRHLRQHGLPEDLEVIVRKGDTLAMNPALPRWHDLEELEKAHRAARSAENPEALHQVVRLYRGPALDGCYMDWALRLREQVEDKVTHALARLAQRALAGGDAGEALEHTRRLLELRPHRQDAMVLQMQAHLALGRPQDGLRDYRRFTRLLQEYEAEPTLELLEAYHRAQLGLSRPAG